MDLLTLPIGLRPGLLLVSILILVGSCASQPPHSTPEMLDQVPITQDPFLAIEVIPVESEPSPAQRLAEITLEFEEAIRTGNMARALDLYPIYGQALTDAGLDETDLPILLGNLLLSSGEIAEASVIFEELFDSSPENLEILVPLSIIALVQNDQPRLTRLYDQILAIDPNNSDALTGKGILAFSRERHNEAIDLFNSALLADNGNLQALFYRAQTLFALNELEPAVRDLSRIINMDPKLDFVWALRGRIRAADGDIVGGLEDLDQAVRLNPNSPWNLLDRGRIAFRGGRAEQAAQDFRDSLALDPQNFLTRVFLAQSYDVLGQNSQAAQQYRQVLTQRPDYHPAFLPAAVSFFKNRDFLDARRLFTQAAQARDGRNELIFLAVLSSFYGGQRTEGIRLMNEWLPQFPQNSLFWHVARYFITPAHEVLALQQIQRSQPTFERSQAQVFMGAMLFLNQRTSTALALLTDMGEDTLRGLPEGAIAQWLMNEHIQ
jgi:tetratricopeptide (TPR) repeat protein